LIRGTLIALTAVLVGSAGCVEVRTVDCYSQTCPVGWMCNDELQGCFSPEQTQSCEGQVDGDDCEFSGVPEGRCEAGVCLAIVCGNDRIDPGEVCDDGNSASGDGCNATCESREVCGNGIVDPATGEQCDDGNQLSHDGCSSGCTAEQPAWTLINRTEFSPRSRVALAYDAAGERVLMFGGRISTGSGKSNATWQYDGQQWTQLHPETSPSERDGAAMVYDPLNRRIVLFGGRPSGADVLADTWVFDGTTWTQLVTATSPPARTEQSMVYDVANQRIMMFGGSTASLNYFNDTWVFENGDWTQVGASAPVKPLGRIGRSLAYHSQLDTVYLHGGFGDSGSVNEWLSDMWQWSGTEWTAVPGPPPLGRGELVYDSFRERLVVAGANWSTTFSEWKSGSWTNVVNAEQLPYFTDVVFDPQRAVLVRVGGLNGLGPVAQTWELGAGTWVRRDDLGGPATREETHMVFDTRRQRAVLFGGRDPQGSVLADTWEFDGGTWQQVTVKRPPRLTLNYSTSVYDGARDLTLLLHGVGGTLRQFEFQGGPWTTLPSLVPHSGPLHSAYDDARQVVVLTVGGSTYELDDTGWNQVTTSSSPAGTGEGAMTYDATHQRVVLFGEPGVTWIYEAVGDQRTWRTLETDGAPPARGNPGMVYHAGRGTVLMFGGDVFGVAQNDLWELNGSTWTQLSTALTPLARATPAMVYSPVRKAALLYGSPPTLGTWELRWVSAFPDEQCAAAGDEDLDGAEDCSDPDCAGASCNASGHRCVAGACVCPGGPTEQACGDGYDDDCDGAIDCADSDCATDAFCNQESECTNGLDDDLDGLYDCAEPQCAGVGLCEVVETNCTDGLDNDGDLKADCADPDCYQVPCKRLLLP